MIVWTEYNTIFNLILECNENGKVIVSNKLRRIRFTEIQNPLKTMKNKGPNILSHVPEGSQYVCDGLSTSVSRCSKIYTVENMYILNRLGVNKDANNSYMKEFFSILRIT